MTARYSGKERCRFDGMPATAQEYTGGDSCRMDKIMKVVLLNHNDRVYTSKAYFVLGSWKRLEDLSTLVDVGIDGSILSALEKIHTGVGKRKVDQVILTHNHYDHTGNLAAIKNLYNPVVYAFSKGPYVDKCLKDGDMIRLGDRVFQVIHTPAHSSDSVCLYCKEERVLFSGDTPLRILSLGGRYPDEFIRILVRLRELSIQVIYSGHDAPYTMGISEMLEHTLENVKASTKLI